MLLNLLYCTPVKHLYWPLLKSWHMYETPANHLIMRRLLPATIYIYTISSAWPSILVYMKIYVTTQAVYMPCREMLFYCTLLSTTTEQEISHPAPSLSLYSAMPVNGSGILDMHLLKHDDIAPYSYVCLGTHLYTETRRVSSMCKY